MLFFYQALLGIVLFVLMLLVGAESGALRLRLLLSHKYSVCVTLFAQYFILPSLAMWVAFWLELSDAAFVALLLVTCCPGGLLSNVLTRAVGGHVSLSVLLTALTTVLSFMSTPLLLKLYTTLSNRDLSFVVPYMSILYALLALMLPFILGVYWGRARRQHFLFLGRVFPYLLCIVVLLLFTLWIEDVWTLWAKGGGDIILAIFCIVILGMMTSYMLIHVFKCGERSAIAVAFEVGIQNSVLAFAILNLSFTSEEKVLKSSIIIAYGLISAIIAVLFAPLFRLRVANINNESQKKVSVGK